MEDICTGCLSTGRKLNFIDETGYYHIYSQIMNETPMYDLSIICIRVCWECRARLRGIHLFKQQAMRSLTDLMQQIPPCSSSLLSSRIQYNFSYPEVKSETDEVSVKIEPLGHCEPEPFATALSVQPDADGNDFKKDTQLKKKKKLKMKLKSTNKKKVKKKTKKRQNSVNFIDTDIEQESVGGDNEEGQMEDINKEGQTEEADNKEARMEEGVNKERTTEEVKEIGENKETNLNKDKVLEDKNIAQKTAAVKRTRNSSPLPDRPQCQECGKVFSSKKTYRYHLNVLHKGQNQYPCPRCGKVYQWKSNLGRHMRSHRAVDDGELYCSLCDKSFASVATYRQHLKISRRHVPEADFSFACDDCGKRFVNKTRLRDHVDWEHLNRIKFRCLLCEKPFKCHTSLYVHTQNVHVGKEKKDNLCHVCGKSYQNAAKLKYHITAMHSGETPYRCAQCGAAFGWYSSLYRHMREVHYKMKGASKKKKQKREETIQYVPFFPKPQ